MGGAVLIPSEPAEKSPCGFSRRLGAAGCSYVNILASGDFLNGERPHKPQALDDIPSTSTRPPLGPGFTQPEAVPPASSYVGVEELRPFIFHVSN
jgi:hypothetical protein